ncbi:DUF4236 domain-containing protein [Thermoactinospora rubra]|uniref:DUF4236 domain-containing protein n=1 Tax=Thermoactinospora rubra TaxID=1088767 RepID=UPI000A10118E|nr:DUF4236 domain-containing protein [Thermoactinospora rubra]
MGLSYRKSIKLGPFRINLSNRGVGHSYGNRLFRVTNHPDGRRTVSVNLPGNFTWRKTTKRK